MFFASGEHCQEFVAEPYAKYEERAPDKWNELIKALYSEGAVKLRVLKSKDEAKILKPEQILGEQLRNKGKGGQIVELEAVVAEKPVQAVLCELANENWVLVYC